MTAAGFEGIALVSINETWSALRFRPRELVPTPRSERVKEAKPQASKQNGERVVIVPEDLQIEFAKHPAAQQFFDRLAYTHRKEYVRWITDAKRSETRGGRIEKTIAFLNEGIKNPHVKK